MRKSILAGIAAGAVLGAGGLVAADLATETADAQGGFSVTAGQLQINQKISQAAVRRSNRSLNYLAPIRTSQTDNADDGTNGVTPLQNVPGSGDGWTNSQIANGAINSEKIAPGGVTSGDLANNAVTGEKIDAGAVTQSKIGPNAVGTAEIADSAVTRSKVAPGLLSYWAVVDAAGNLARSQPSTGVTAESIGPGEYAVTFPAAIEQCAFQVSIASENNQPPTPLNNGAISAFAQSAVTVEVRTYSLQSVPPVPQIRDFHLTVNC